MGSSPMHGARHDGRRGHLYRCGADWTDDRVCRSRVGQSFQAVGLVQRCEFRFSLPTFVGLARLPTFVELVRLTRFHLVGIDRERGVLATRQLPAARMTRPTRPTAIVPVPVSGMVDPEIPAARMTPLTHPTAVVPVPVSAMADRARSAHPIPTHRGRPRARGGLRARQTPAGRMNRPKVIVPVPVSVMVDPARSTHPVSTHRDRPRARGVLRPRQLPAARRVNPPKMVPEPVSVMVVSIPASARGHRGRPTIRSQDSPAPARSTSTVHPPARPAHQDSPPPAGGGRRPRRRRPRHV